MKSPGRRWVPIVCGYMGGMTDSYAIAEHRTLFGETPDLHLSESEAKTAVGLNVKA